MGRMSMRGNSRTPRLLASLTVLVVTLGLWTSCTAQGTVNYVATASYGVTKTAANLDCQQQGGSLPYATDASTHTRITTAVRAAKPTGDYFTFLGASTTMSPNCPANSPSLNCVWYWETGVYQNAPVAFYRGNMRPPFGTRPGLTGSGPMNGLPTYWAVIGGGAAYPSSRYFQHLVLFSYPADGVEGSWADNSIGPGFDSLVDVSASLPNFYVTCRVIEMPPPPDSHESSSSAVATIPPATSSSSFVPPQSSFTFGSSHGGGEWVPSRNETDPDEGGVPPAKDSSVGAGTWIGLAVAIVVVVVLIIILCCCRRRLAACCCPEKNLVKDDGSYYEDDYANHSDDEVDSKRSFSVPSGSYTAVNPSGDSKSTSRRLRRRLSDASIATTTPDDLRAAHAGGYSHNEDAESVYAESVTEAQPAYTDGLPPAGAAAYPPAAPPVAAAAAAAPVAVPVYDGKAATPRSPAALSNEKRSLDSDENSRSIRQSRTVSFVE